MSRSSEFFIRISAFVRKEIIEILRQPRLLATLILGPFLILLIFGVGYRNDLRIMRTVLVVPAESKIQAEIIDIARHLRGAVDLNGIVSSIDIAREMVRSSEVDLALVTPTDPYSDVQQNTQARFAIYHQEIDPLEELYVSTLERAYVNEVNRLILIRAIDDAKVEAGNVLEKVQIANQDAATTREALEKGDGEAAAAGATRLIQDFNELNLALASSVSVFEGLQGLSVEDEQEASPLDNLEEIEEALLELEALDPQESQYDVELAELDFVTNELDQIEAFLSSFEQTDSGVMVRPFKGETVSITAMQLGPIDFYVPGVIALLLQHIALTLGALSLVRERRGGAIELFRAAPVSAFETLSGKAISFLIMSFILAIVLTLLIVVALNVPMLGTWAAYLIVILLLLYASLAMGFAISAISQTDSQAVQYSMIVLLASIFFSGFFIALHRLADGVHIVSWLLPATYGTELLQDIMLRGLSPDPLLVAGLFGLGFFLFAFAWWRLRRQMARE